MALDESIEIGEAADIDAHLDALVEGRDPARPSVLPIDIPRVATQRSLDLQPNQQVIEAAQGISTPS